MIPVRVDQGKNTRSAADFIKRSHRGLHRMLTRDPEASGEQRGEGSLGKNGGAKAYDEGGLAIVGVKVRRFR